jgi:luciferase family oxidoreductase group 1
MTPISILDLVNINQNSTPQVALNNSLALAKKAEVFGYNRVWVAEHHNFPSIASAATSVVIGFLLANTKKIRVGAGGIMLPNHSPLVIAEQFGTLETLYPGRVDLGLGRAPGTDQRTMKALRKDPMSAQNFPNDVQEVQSYFEVPTEKTQIQAIPGSGLHVPLWILGSSTYGAQLAAALGLPYAFASHFAPDSLMDAIAIYRQNFKPSKQLQKPYVMIGVNIIAADTDKEARYLFTSIQQAFANIARSARGPFPPPIDNIDSYWTPQEKMMATNMLSYSVVGSKESVQKGLEQILQKTKADELMVVGAIYDLEARIRSFELLSQIFNPDF